MEGTPRTPACSSPETVVSKHSVTLQYSCGYASSLLSSGQHTIMRVGSRVSACIVQYIVCSILQFFASEKNGLPATSDDTFEAELSHWIHVNLHVVKLRLSPSQRLLYSWLNRLLSPTIAALLYTIFLYMASKGVTSIKSLPRQVCINLLINV